MTTRPVALTIAGTDSGGGAGAVADVKTFAAHGVWGTVAVTAVTAQNTRGVTAVGVLDADLVYAQLRAVAVDIGIDAAKTGMLGSPHVIDAVVRGVRDFGVGPLVVDPVLAATSGDALIGDMLTTADLLGALRTELLRLAAVVTPNLDEAAALAGGSIATRADVENAAREILAFGPAAVLVTGGHLPGAPDDCLLARGTTEAVWLAGRRVDSPATHGTGCVLSAAIAARLALGQDMETACRGAKGFVAGALASGVLLGSGPGAVDPCGPKLSV